MFLGLGDGELAEMEDRGGEHGRGAALDDAVDQVVELADAARCHHRHRYGIRYRTGELEIEARPGAVAVHRGQQDLAGAMVGHAPRTLDSVEAGALAAAMGAELPFAGSSLAGVDRYHDALVSVFLAPLPHEVSRGHRAGVGRHI